MGKKIFLLLLVSLIFLIPYSSKAVRAEDNDPESDHIEAKQLDTKAEILAQYLAKYNSPLENHAQDFIDAAKTYNLDWKLVPAIAGVESTFGKFIPGGFNGWGWGVYGTQAIYFNSWTEAIFTVSKGLRENYLNKGLTDPYLINKAYAASDAWGGKVTYFMADLEKFALQFEGQKISLPEVTPKIAAVSGQLVLE